MRSKTERIESLKHLIKRKDSIRTKHLLAIKKHMVEVRMCEDYIKKHQIELEALEKTI